MGLAVITGASRGIGKALAEHLAAEGVSLVLGCRDPAAVRTQAPEGADVRTLNASDQASVRSFADTLAGEKIDILINNAGIAGGSLGSGLEDTDWTVTDDIFRTNVVGPLLLAQLLADNLADGGTIANVTSVLGSCEQNTSGGMVLYRASKAALNSVTRTLAAELGPKGVTVLAIHPGWVQTDMGGKDAAVNPVDSAAGIANVITRAGPGEQGCFLDWQGKEIPW